MRRINATAYVRVPFTINDPENYKKLELLMKHDDGFIAYLNGKKVAEKNAPPSPSWNSTATTSSGEADVNEYEIYDISSHCLLYTSPSPRDKRQSRMPSSA